MYRWRPISTAPANEKVLVWVPDFNKITIAWYSTKTGLWPADQEYNDDDEPCNVGLPSHWMPIPNPPKPQLAEMF